MQPASKRLKVNQEECISVQSSLNEDKGEDQSVEIISHHIKAEDYKKGAEVKATSTVKLASSVNFGKQINPLNTDIMAKLREKYN